MNEFESASFAAMQQCQAGERPSPSELTALTVRFPFYIQCVLGAGDPDIPGEESALKDSEQKTDIMIGAIENGVDALRDKMTAVTRDIPPHVLSPFNRIRRNEANPLRNKYACRLAAMEGRLSQSPIPQNAFFYMLAGEARQKSSAATFRLADRTFFGNEHFSQDSDIDGLVACHEAVHITQDDAERSAITTVQGASEYLARRKFLSERKRMVVNAELPAYGCELQIANFTLNGMLQDPQAVRESEVMGRLGAKDPDQKMIVKTLLKLARAFPNFADHQHGQSFPMPYVMEIANLYRAEGYEVLKVDPDSGGFLPL